MLLHTSELESFVKKVQSLNGNLNHPEVAQHYPIELKFDTQVDESLCPFSPEYMGQQMALYEEISGRKLDQATGELHPVDIEALLGTPNPLGIGNTAQVAENVRAMSTMLSILNLGERPRVLDMGAGHGLSSEILAFCGCDVHSVDIDPALGELASRRARARGLRVTRHLLNFDNLETLPDGFDAAFFFQSLHHSIRPWELIGNLKNKLHDGGVIAFSGEPIQTNSWRHWGLRLDHESLYVARAYGWFESGWSRSFITRCFERHGLSLQLFTGGHGGGEIGIAARKGGEAIAARAAALGFAVAREPLRYSSAMGKSCTLNEKRGFSGEGEGWLSFGPYISLQPGAYMVSFFVEGTGTIAFDVTADHGQVAIHREVLTTSGAVTRTIRIESPLDNVEARLYMRGKWAASYPEFHRIGISEVA